MRSISSKINMFLFLLVFLPLCAILILIFVQVKQSTTAMTGESLARVVDVLAHQVDALIGSMEHHVTAIATSPVVASDTTSLADKMAEIKKVQEIHNVFEDVVLLDLAGNVQGASRYAYSGQIWTRTWFAWQDQPCFQKAKAGETCVSEIDAPGSPFALSVVVAAPVWSPDGTIRRCVGARLNMRRIWDITGTARIGQTAAVLLVNARGRLLAHPQSEMLLRDLEPETIRKAIREKPSGTLEYLAAGNMLAKICSYQRLTAPAGSAPFGWVLAVTQDIEETYALVENLKQQVLAFSVGSLVFLFLLGGFLSRQIILPIQELVRATERIAAGNLNARVETRTNDEIGNLAKSFNQMTGDLQQAIFARDQEIKARREAQDLLRTARFQKDFAGLLNIISISDVIQLINVARKSGTLEIRCFPAKVLSSLAFLDGEIIAATCNGVTGVEAVYRALRSKGEEFSFAAGSPPRPEKPITQRTIGLLMEASRLMDEGGKTTQGGEG